MTVRTGRLRAADRSGNKAPDYTGARDGTAIAGAGAAGLHRPRKGSAFALESRRPEFLK